MFVFAQGLRGLAQRVLSAAFSLIVAPAAVAQAVTIPYLDGQNPVAPDAITAYGNDLFGDRINLFNGGLSFEHTDISLPGNSRLPVALVRRHTPGQPDAIRGQFGDWDLEAPRLGGTFSIAVGWVTGSGGSNRCSGFSAPPTVNKLAGYDGNRVGDPHAAAATARSSDVTPSAIGATTVGFVGSDYWRGTQLIVPGSGSQEVLKRNGNYTLAPADGGSYPLVTHGNWQIGCLPSIQNGGGEGFVAVSPDGVRYRFDWMATRLQTDVKKAGAQLGRNDFYLMATQVTDRFGNWVTYTYDPASPLLLKRIESSDGRVITITNSGGRATSAFDGTRTFQYQYDAAGSLTAVVQPDGSSWTFNLKPLIPPNFEQVGEGANCDYYGSPTPTPLVGTIKHPSGAVGSFTMMQLDFGRTCVQRVCNFAPNSKTITIGAVYPRYVNSQALVNKQITGPGMAAMTWAYEYTAPFGWDTCTSGPCLLETRTVTVTEPAGNRTRHVFGNRWHVNEGQLLQVDEGWNGSTALKTTTYRYRDPAGQAYPEQFGSSVLKHSDWLSTRHRPQDRRQITQQSSTFTWEVDASASGFDGLARPRLVRKASSLGYARTELTDYYDLTAKWVMGQTARVTETTTGLVMNEHSFDATLALPTGDYAFGKLQKGYSYRADGTIEVVKDAAGRATGLSNFRRGKPQWVQFPDGSSASQSVNNLGGADWQKNAAGTVTSYQYDAMGRVARIIYPSEATGSYFDTTQEFVQIPVDEYGLEPGHWRQVILTGNAARIRYFDGLWRPRLELQYDLSAQAETSIYVETRWGLDGRKSFESYPDRTPGGLQFARPGRSLQYDALGRTVLEVADSEIGPLQTRTDYPAGSFAKVVTNPRNLSTTQWFQAFDAPETDHIVQIAAPEGVSVSIPRDLFGKALSITRGGNGKSATRTYVYDGYQRLCKTLEPESGATVQDYDLAGNVAWKASGLVLPSTSSCDQSSVPEARKIVFGYDTLNRLTTTTHGDGSTNIGRTYTPDGLLQTIITPNFGWTYVYNNRRLLTSEQLNNWQGTRTFGYGIDAYGHVASLSYPDGGPTVVYSPDAFGHPRQISGYASGITFHANGSLAGYTAANGVQFSMSQNVRGLPLLWRHAGVVQDLYAYDANGNVQAITDQQEGVASRSMAYDDLDRLTTANGIWGIGNYGYDALDNLVGSLVGGRLLSHNINYGTNRLESLSGAFSMEFTYDANGNVVSRGSQQFQFDIANRMTIAYGVASYTYDGHGRRAWAQAASGRTTLRAYGKEGRLLLTSDSQKGKTWHIHLGNRVVAETNSITGTRWLHTDALGSPVAATGSGGAVLEKTRYEPYGKTAAGTNPEGIGFTGHVNDVETGLIYMQQRYYEPLAGRFLSVDPVTTDANDGNDFGRYTYVDNNPYSKIDADGRQGVGPTNLFPNFDPIRFLKNAVAEAANFVLLASGGAGGTALKGLEGAAVVGKLGEAADLGGVALKGEVTVYRVFGGDSRAQGFSWTTVDPRKVANFRDGAGLPSGGPSGATNTADFMVKGQASASDVITSRPALPLDGNQGGLPELIIDPKNVKITDFSVLRP